MRASFDFPSTKMANKEILQKNKDIGTNMLSLKEKSSSLILNESG
jgi:hypothetical protein